MIHGPITLAALKQKISYFTLFLDIKSYWYTIPPTLHCLFTVRASNFFTCQNHVSSMSIADWSQAGQSDSGLCFHVAGGCNPLAKWKPSFHNFSFRQRTKTSDSGMTLPPLICLMSGYSVIFRFITHWLKQGFELKASYNTCLKLSCTVQCWHFLDLHKTPICIHEYNCMQFFRNSIRTWNTKVQ